MAGAERGTESIGDKGLGARPGAPHHCQWAGGLPRSAAAPPGAGPSAGKQPRWAALLAEPGPGPSQYSASGVVNLQPVPPGRGNFAR